MSPSPNDFDVRDYRRVVNAMGIRKVKTESLSPGREQALHRIIFSSRQTIKNTKNMIQHAKELKAAAIRVIEESTELHRHPRAK